MTFETFKTLVRKIVGDEPSDDIMDALTAMENEWVDDSLEEHMRAEEERTRAENVIRERDEIKRKYYERFWEGETITDESVAGSSEDALLYEKPTNEIENIANSLFLI